MASPSVSDQSSKRDAILDAALELFAERGFHGTAVPLVAERAGVAAGTLYRYFDGKEALVNALYQREKLSFGGALTEGFPVDAPPRQQFHVLWERLWWLARERSTSMQFLELHHHSEYLDEQSHEVELRVMGPIFMFIARAQEQQALKCMAPEPLIALVYGAFLGLLKAQVMGHLTPTPQVIAQTEDCVWEMVRR